MARFTDQTGRDWVVELNVSSLKTIRSQLDINLMDVLDDGAKLLQRLYADVVLLADCLWVLCQQQCEERKLTQHDFGALLANDTLFNAATAFFQALTDFFPNPRLRDQLGKLIAKANQTTDLMLEMAGRQVDDIDPESLAKQLSNSATNSRASSESIQANTHLGS